MAEDWLALRMKPKIAAAAREHFGEEPVSVEVVEYGPGEAPGGKSFKAVARVGVQGHRYTVSVEVERDGGCSNLRVLTIE